MTEYIKKDSIIKAWAEVMAYEAELESTGEDKSRWTQFIEAAEAILEGVAEADRLDLPDRVHTKGDDWGRVYLSGKMSGLPRKQFRAKFNVAHNMLVVKHGIHPDNIVSPVSMDMMFPGFEYEDFMALDLIAISRCDTIYLLNNWKDSKGAHKEKAFAERMGLRVEYQPEEKELELKWRVK